MLIFFRLILKGFRELRFNVCSQVMTLATVTLIVFLGAMFILLIHNIKIQLYQNQGNITFEVYWHKGVSESLVKKQWQEIRQIPSVSSVITYTSDQALQTLGKNLQSPMELNWMESKNPLPPTAVITVSLSADEAKKRIEDLQDRFQKIKGVNKVHFNPLRAKNVSSWIAIINRLVWPFTALLALIIGVIIGNTFKLSQLYRKEELEVLKLIGASRIYIQLPLLFGSGLQAILSSCLALFLLKTCQTLLLALLNVAPIWIEIEFLTLPQLGSIIGLLFFVSVFSSWLAIRK